MCVSRFRPFELILSGLQKRYSGWKIPLSISLIVNRVTNMAETVIFHFLSFPLISFIPLFRGSHERFDGIVRNLSRLFSDLKLGMINSSFTNVVLLLGSRVLGILVKNSLSLDRNQKINHLILLDPN